MEKLNNSNITTLKVYAYIRDYIEEHKYAPSLREIQVALGQKSISTTNYHMKKLFRFGMLETDIEGNDLLSRAYRLGKNPLC